ncbi:unnamed protein product [Protopolystoma xenopodis]|uniref:Uncharacterized protein n=1 Tax=Protopolystoma xenopodis TaxID=117903 RepID=A0A448XCU5_9PLAT|nr:unnamed protein product [Protopolystoma xenopodis]
MLGFRCHLQFAIDNQAPVCGKQGTTISLLQKRLGEDEPLGSVLINDDIQTTGYASRHVAPHNSPLGSSGLQPILLHLEGSSVVPTPSMPEVNIRHQRWVSPFSATFENVPSRLFDAGNHGNYYGRRLLTRCVLSSRPDNKTKLRQQVQPTSTTRKETATTPKVTRSWSSYLKREYDPIFVVLVAATTPKLIDDFSFKNRLQLNRGSCLTLVPQLGHASTKTLRSAACPESIQGIVTARAPRLGFPFNVASIWSDPIFVTRPSCQDDLFGLNSPNVLCLSGYDGSQPRSVDMCAVRPGSVDICFRQTRLATAEQSGRENGSPIGTTEAKCTDYALAIRSQVGQVHFCDFMPCHASLFSRIEPILCILPHQGGSSLHPLHDPSARSTNQLVTLACSVARISNVQVFALHIPTIV